MRSFASVVTVALCFVLAVAETHDHCVSLKEKIEGDLVAALQRKAVFKVQKGSLDFTLVGADEVIDCEEKNCAYTNPKSPYGLFTLPLSPSEELGKKLDGTFDLPEWSASNLDGSQGWTEGFSPTWQLRQDEVLMLFGCTPPPETSRYFSVTGYVHDMYSEDQGEWLSVFGSLGDTKSIIREPKGSFGFENRLRTSADQPLNLDFLTDREEIASHDSAFNEITLVLMGASMSTVARAERVAGEVLKQHGIRNIVNVIGIPSGFGEVGLPSKESPYFSYYSMIVRNILADNNIDGFATYAGDDPLSAWRMTPVVSRPSSNVEADRFTLPKPEVIPRVPEGDASNQEGFLAEALEELISKVQERYSGSHVVAHGFGAASSLGLMDIDYGADCVRREIDYCNGDNRDAMYLSTYPLMVLDTAEKFSYVVGVNHRVVGTTLYNNVAVSDPLARMGVASMDDVEIEGSAQAFLKGTSYEDMQQYLYAIRFARDCTGVPFCTTIPFEGGRSVAKDTQILLTQRLYVNPQTGVGPDSQSILMPHMMMFTPKAASTDKDVRRRLSPEVVNNSQCMASFVGLTTCVSGLNDVCCENVSSWTQGGCFCDELGEMLLETLPENFGVRELKGLSLLCGAVPLPCNLDIKKVAGDG